MKEKKVLSLAIIFTGIAMFCSYHIYYHFVDKANDNLVRNFYQKEDMGESDNIKVEKISNNDTAKEEYYGILSIPKINLKTGFYNINSKNNNVNNSVTILKESIPPENDNSIVYLAAHSGVGHLAYFKNINKLTNEDMIYLNINSKSYYYTITDIYEMPRNGLITVERNINEKYLVLTTCSNNENMQLVIVSKMINKVI